jgi:hypothetical protein
LCRSHAACGLISIVYCELLLVARRSHRATSPPQYAFTFWRKYRKDYQIVNEMEEDYYYSTVVSPTSMYYR